MGKTRSASARAARRTISAGQGAAPAAPAQAAAPTPRPPAASPFQRDRAARRVHAAPERAPDAGRLRGRQEDGCRRRHRARARRLPRVAGRSRDRGACALRAVRRGEGARREARRRAAPHRRRGGRHRSVRRPRDALQERARPCGCACEKLLDQASVRDAVDIHKELTKITEEIERLEGKLKLLRDRVAFLDHRGPLRAQRASSAFAPRRSSRSPGCGPWASSLSWRCRDDSPAPDRARLRVARPRRLRPPDRWQAGARLRPAGERHYLRLSRGGARRRRGRGARRAPRRARRRGLLGARRHAAHARDRRLRVDRDPRRARTGLAPPVASSCSVTTRTASRSSTASASSSCPASSWSSRPAATAPRSTAWRAAVDEMLAQLASTEQGLVLSWRRRGVTGLAARWCVRQLVSVDREDHRVGGAILTSALPAPAACGPRGEARPSGPRAPSPRRGPRRRAVAQLRERVLQRDRGLVHRSELLLRRAGEQAPRDLVDGGRHPRVQRRGRLQRRAVPCVVCSIFRTTGRARWW